jgi:carboxyl-terminal processing protease
VLAGALQDNDRALIIGEKTFGKGLVQTVIGLPGGTGLTLTTARYFTPTGRLIQRDYAHTGNYDYFRHLQTAEVAASVKMRTRRNRIVTSGDGISPDKPVLSEPVTASRLALLDPIFFFSRDIIRGRLAGLSPKTAISGENNGKLADEFAKFAAFWPNGSVLALKNTDWAISQIRYHIILAAEGAAAADRFRLKNDTAVLAAIESMPEARIFAASIFAPKLANAREK